MDTAITHMFKFFEFIITKGEPKRSDQERDLYLVYKDTRPPKLFKGPVFKSLHELYTLLKKGGPLTLTPSAVGVFVEWAESNLEAAKSESLSIMGLKPSLNQALAQSEGAKQGALLLQYSRHHLELYLQVKGISYSVVKQSGPMQISGVKLKADPNLASGTGVAN